MAGRKRPLSPEHRKAVSIGLRAAHGAKWALAYEPRTCRHCGKGFSFYLPESRGDGDGQFCSVNCRWAYHRSHSAQHPTTICAKCGNLFSHWPSTKRKYCSAQCSGRAWINRITVLCQECGESYKVEHKRASNTKCCSMACLAKYFARVKRQFGLDCKRRCHTKSWLKLRQAIIERDGRKCRICGSDHLLAVHHINPWWKVKQDDPKNLATLCKACHHRVEFVDRDYLTRMGIN